MRLYEIVTHYRDALRYLEDHADEIDAAGGEMPGEVLAMIDAAEGDLNSKAENIALLIRELYAEAEAIGTERDRLVAMADMKMHNADRLKKYLHEELIRAGVDKVEGKLVNIRTQKNSRPSLRLTDADVIPPKWSKTTTTFNSAAAYLELKNTGKLGDLRARDEITVDGVIVSLGSHLRIW